VKVIGFDSWTGGAHNFERLVDALKKRGLILELIHLGSWGNDLGRPVEERNGSLVIHDVSFYSGTGFLDIITSERPAAVIFLSTDTFAHRAFNRYCKERGVPTLHLYHGLVSVQATDEDRQHGVNFVSQFRFVSSRLRKALTKVWPNYAVALWRTRASASEWGRFARDIVDLSLGRYISKSAADAKTTRCCVYTAGDVDHAREKYGFATDEISVVGNPDLIRFGLSSDCIGAALPDLNAAGPEIMYIDTGLVYAGAVFRDADDFLEHLVLTKTSLEAQGRSFVVKLHPDHFRTSFPAALASAGIEVCSTEDFVSRLQGCCAAIAEPSTASLIPALLGIPLLLAKYGRLNEQRYGEVLTSYPRARLLVDISDVNSLLADEQASCDPARVWQWIDDNAGPLPATQMPERVAEVVFNMIKKVEGQTRTASSVIAAA